MPPDYVQMSFQATHKPLHSKQHEWSDVSAHRRYFKAMVVPCPIFIVVVAQKVSGTNGDSAFDQDPRFEQSSCAPVPIAKGVNLNHPKMRDHCLENGGR